MSYAGYASVHGYSATFPGSPELDVRINSIGGGTEVALPHATMDTGSTGVVTTLSEACNKLFSCTGSSAQNYVADPSAVIGYGTITYDSDNKSYAGFYTNVEVKVRDGSGATTMSTSQVPIFIAVNAVGETQSQAPAQGVQMFGIGFGRDNAAGIQLKDANGNFNGVTLYGKTLNPFLNLTQLNLGGGLTNNISSIAPGYVVTSQGIYLGLSSSVASAQGPFVALAPQQAAPGSNVSAYAAAATARDWQTPPMVMQVSNNTPHAGGTPVNGYYYGMMLVDTGIDNAILTAGKGNINPALINSTTPTYITIGLPGIAATTGPSNQYTYVFQGICTVNPPMHQGCGPAPMTAYNGSQAALMVPVYPISSRDSSVNGTPGHNTGFANDGRPSPFLNTGVSFLNYFNVVYDPVNGFIGYQPNGNPAGVPASLLSTSPMLGLQGSFSIPNGTDVGLPIFLFTDIGNQTNPSYAPVDVALSAASPGGTVTVSQPITSDIIANCTLANCSTGVIINQGNFIFNAANTYAGATTINPGAALALGANGSIANSYEIIANGTFDISSANGGASIASLGGGGSVTLGNRTLTVSNGHGAFSGTIDDGGLGGSFVMNGGVQTLSGANTFSGPTTVDAGKLIVNGSIANSSTTVNPGGVIGGSGVLGTTTINGGTISPGNSVGTITVNGNLFLTSAATYLLEVSSAGADRINVTGSASLAGNLTAAFQPGSSYAKTYTILSSGAGRTGAFDTFTMINQPAGLAFDLSYTSTDVVLTLTAVLGQNAGLNRNQQNVANVLDASFNNGSLPAGGLHQLFSFAGSGLARALTQASGEAAGGAQQAGMQLTNQFLSLMLDPFLDGRNRAQRTRQTLGFAPESTPQTESVALAYSGITKALAKKEPVSERQWGGWGTAYGGSNRTEGSAVVGSNDLYARTAGFAGGLDYRLTPDTTAGFALAGGGTSWSLNQGLGGGRSDAFQAGAYGVSRSGAAYIAASLAYTNHWMSTDRISPLGGHLTANFNATSYGGRLEGGYRFDGALAAVTPYAALQAQRFQTPRYGEFDVNNSGFALSYDDRNATGTRSELGTRVERVIALDRSTELALRGRLAWAHDWVSDPTLTVAFQSLPSSSFIVSGATPATDSALVSAGAEFRFASGVTLMSRFDGEFAANSSTFGGTATLRYVW